MKATSTKALIALVLGALAPTFGGLDTGLDPAHDWNIARAEVHRIAGDFFSDTQQLPRGYTNDYALNVTQFQKAGDVWLPMEATLTSFRKQPEGHYSRSEDHLKRTEVRLAPDFRALRAFEPYEVRDGARFVKDGAPGYLWQQGNLVPEPPGKRTTAGRRRQRHRSGPRWTRNWATDLRCRRGVDYR